MAERPFVSQVVQIGPEVTAGVAVPATKRLQSLRLVPTVENTNTKETPMGYLYPTVVAEGQEWTTLEATGIGAYTEMQYLMCSMFGKTTPTQIGVTGAYTWVNQGKQSDIDDPQTYSVEVGDTHFAEKISFAHFTDWDLTLTRKAVSVKGKMLAQLLTTGQTLTGTVGVNEVQTLVPSTAGDAWTGGTFTLTFGGQTTTGISYDAFGIELAAALTDLSTIGVDTNNDPNVTVTGPAGGPWTVTFVNDLGHAAQALLTDDLTSITSSGTKALTITEVQLGAAAAPISGISVVPILAKEGKIFLDTSFGSIGSTKLTRDFSATISNTGKYGPEWPIDRDQTSWAASVGLEPKTSLKLQMMADTAGLNPLAYLRTGQTVYLRFDYLSDKIAGSSGSNHFRYTLDVAAKVELVGKFSDADGVYVLEYTFQPVADPDSGFAFKSTLINNQSAL